MPKINEKQALVPKGSIVLYNENGTAPGIIIEKDGKIAILLPGPGNEFCPMYLNSVKPYLEKKSGCVIVSKTVKMCGIGESAVDEKIRDLTEKGENPTVAPYAKTGEVHVRITAKAETEKEANKLIKPVVREMKNRFGDFIYTTDDETTLEKAVVELLLANHLTVSTVESCTGGLVAGRLINVPGVSEVLKLSYVTYSNKAKRKLLGIKKGILQKYTAVSPQVCEEMLKGASLINKADVVVSVTGLAGPDGGTEDTPVGTVYIGCSVKGKITVQKYIFSGNRAKIRENAVAHALILLRRCVLEYFSEVTFGQEG
jgi:nicotinamide-nucleotide amidase